MKLKQILPKTVKILTNLVLVILLIYWTWLALTKFIEQPTATYMSYSKGDDNVNLEFPHIFFCTYGENGFVKKILDNLEANSSFDAMAYVESQSANIDDFFLNGSFHHKNRRVKQTLDKTLFYKAYELNWGPCIGFHLNNFSITINEGQSSSGLTYIKLNVNLSAFKSENIFVYFHSGYDASDAMSTNPYMTIRSKAPMTYEVSLKKKVISTQSTNALTCGELNMNACYDIDGTQKVADEFGCKVPFLNNGKHLQKYVSGYDQLPICTQEVLHGALDLFWNMADDNCKDARACNSIKYDFKEKVHEHTDYSTTIFVLKFSTFEVDHYTTYISYDEQSLIAELGGLLGMTLGLSFSSIGDVLANLIQKHF